MAPTIEALGLVKRYGRATALDGVDLVAERGQVVPVSTMPGWLQAGHQATGRPSRKNLAPGLRLGWLAVPARLVDEVVASTRSSCCRPTTTRRRSSPTPPPAASPSPG